MLVSTSLPRGEWPCEDAVRLRQSRGGCVTISLTCDATRGYFTSPILVFVCTMHAFGCTALPLVASWRTHAKGICAKLILPIISNFNAPRFLAQVKVVVAFQFVNLLHPDINCWMHLGKRIILHEFKIILNSFVCALFYAQRNSLWILFATFFYIKCNRRRQDVRQVVPICEQWSKFKNNEPTNWISKLKCLM